MPNLIEAALEGLAPTLTPDVPAAAVPFWIIGEAIENEIPIPRSVRDWLYRLDVTTFKPVMDEALVGADSWRPSSELDRSDRKMAGCIRMAICAAALHNHVAPCYVPGFVEFSGKLCAFDDAVRVHQSN